MTNSEPNIGLPPAKPHETVQRLLPWYLNGTLAEDERQRVETHLQGCPACRRELIIMRQLAQAMKMPDDDEANVDEAFANFQKRLPPNAAKAVPAHLGKKSPRARWHRPLGAALSAHRVKSYAVAATVMLATAPVVWFSWEVPVNEGFVTLSNTPPATAAEAMLHVVFAKTVPETEVDAVLAKINARRVGAANSAGAYPVALANAAEVTAALAFLRGQPGVVLAEPTVNP